MSVTFLPGKKSFIEDMSVWDFNIHRTFWGSKDVVERKLKICFDFSFILKNWGKKRRKNLIFLLLFDPQMRFSLSLKKKRHLDDCAFLRVVSGQWPLCRLRDFSVWSMLVMLQNLAYMLSESSYIKRGNVARFPNSKSITKQSWKYEWRNFGKKIDSKQSIRLTQKKRKNWK